MRPMLRLRYVVYSEHIVVYCSAVYAITSRIELVPYLCTTTTLLLLHYYYHTITTTLLLLYCIVLFTLFQHYTTTLLPPHRWSALKERTRRAASASCPSWIRWTAPRPSESRTASTWAPGRVFITGSIVVTLVLLRFSLWLHEFYCDYCI